MNCADEPTRDPTWDESTENACFRFEWVPAELNAHPPCEPAE